MVMDFRASFMKSDNGRSRRLAFIDQKSSEIRKSWQLVTYETSVFVDYWRDGTGECRMTAALFDPYGRLRCVNPLGIQNYARHQREI